MLLLEDIINRRPCHAWPGSLRGGHATPETRTHAAHAAPITGTGPDEIRGREALNAWVSAIHAILPDLNFVIDVGPITDDEHLVVRWKAHGTYSGGFPGGAPDAVGRRVTFTGTDTLRIADGKLAEYWANADSLLLFQQLGVREVPAHE